MILPYPLIWRVSDEGALSFFTCHRPWTWVKGLGIGLFSAFVHWGPFFLRRTSPSTARASAQESFTHSDTHGNRSIDRSLLPLRMRQDLFCLSRAGTLPDLNFFTPCFPVEIFWPVRGSLIALLPTIGLPSNLTPFPFHSLIWDFWKTLKKPLPRSWGCSFAHQSPTWAHQSAKITWNSGSHTSLAYDFSSWNLLVHNHAYGKSSGWAVSSEENHSPAKVNLPMRIWELIFYESPWSRG